MPDFVEIIHLIKRTVKTTAPDATVILYGSFVRGDNHPGSDIDILILLDKEKISRDDEIKVKYPLYDIEFETGQLISPLVFAKADWEKKHKATPFYENVSKEGVVL